MSKTTTFTLFALLLLPLVIMAPAAIAAPAGLASVTASPSIVSPANADGVADVSTLTVVATTGQTLFANVYDSANQLRRTAVPLSEVVAGTYVGTWDGRINGGALATEAGAPYVVKITTSAVGDRLDEGATAATIALDDTAPTGASLDIGGGLRYVTAADRSVTLTLGASVPTAGYQIRVAEGADDGAFAGLAWESFTTTKPFTLSANDGLKTVRLQVRDAAGNTAPTVTATTTLDLTDPTGTVSINGGAASTTSTTVTLTLLASDANGVSQMRLSNDGGVTFPDGWESYATSRSWALAGMGTQSVRVEFRDAAGRTSAAVDGISVAPALAGQSIDINGGATYSVASAGAVTLTLVNPDPATYTRMRFSNTGVPGSFSAPEPTASSKAWTLADPDVGGVKTVHYLLQNADATLTSTATDTIVRDVAVPSAGMTLQSASGFPVTLTTANGVVLVLGADDANGIAGGRLARNSADLATKTFRALPTNGQVVWCFGDDDPLGSAVATVSACPTTTDGVKTISFQASDRAGLTSAIVTRAVTRDTTAPATPTLAIGGLIGGLTSADTLALTIGAADAAQMSFRVDAGTYSAWTTTASTTSLALPTSARTDGVHTIALRVRDEAGNVAESAPATFTRDATAPTGSFNIVSGSAVNPATTPVPSITLTLTASDASGVTAVRIWEGATEPTTTEAFATTKQVTLGSGAGPKTVNVRLFDALGNPSVVLSRGITLVPSGGVSSSLSTVSVSTASYTRSREITITVGTASGDALVAIAEGVRPGDSFAPLVGGVAPFTLADGDGLHEIHVRVRIGGETYAPAPLPVVLDRSTPTTSAPAGLREWRRSGFSFQLQVADATSGPGTTTWRLDEGPTQTGTIVTIPESIADGVHTVHFASRDAAGNEETERSAQVRIDRRAPTTSVDQPQGLRTNLSFLLAFRPTDRSGSGVESVRYRIDSPNGPYTILLAPPFVVEIPRALGDGTHVVEYGALDEAGNEETTRTFSFTFGAVQTEPKPPAPPAPEPGKSQTGRLAGQTPAAGVLELIGGGPLVGFEIRSPGGAPLRGLGLTSTVAPARELPFQGLAVYTNLDIEVTGVPAGTAATLPATLRFNLTRAWLASQDLTPAQIVLLHEAATGWETLRTSVVSQDPDARGFAGNVTFEASTPGLSPFTIAGDATAPVFSSPDPADGSSVVDPLRVEVGLRDNLGVATYALILDGADVTRDAVLRDGLLFIEREIILPGDHTVRARATDVAGNAAEFAWSFTSTVPAEEVIGLAGCRGERETPLGESTWILCLPEGVPHETVRVTVDKIPIPTEQLTFQEDGVVVDLSGFTPGDHDVVVLYDVDGKSTSQSHALTTAAMPPEESTGGVSALGVAFIALGVAVVAAVAIVVVRRRRKP